MIVLFFPHSNFYQEWFKDLPPMPKELQEVL